MALPYRLRFEWTRTVPLPTTKETPMATAGVFPPDEATAAANAGTPIRFTPGVTAAFDGPRRLGPEWAGALTLLHVTFADNSDAQRGYREFAAIKEHFRSRPGFIRFLTFSDGVDLYTLGLWRSVSDVMDFVRSDAHRAAAEGQRRDGYEYSQFAGVWSAHALGARMIHCEMCRTATPAPTAACAQCGNPLDDTFQRDPSVAGA
jgi:heme-degrading monooxygenase HmoA